MLRTRYANRFYFEPLDYTQQDIRRTISVRLLCLFTTRFAELLSESRRPGQSALRPEASPAAPAPVHFLSAALRRGSPPHRK